MIYKLSLAVISLLFSIGTTSASTITNNFSFFNSSNVVIAGGSFSYDSAATGVIGYSDLETFSINVLGQSYDLIFAKGLAGADNYVYFGFDTALHTFVPFAVEGYDIPVSGILAATNGWEGFFIAPLPGQADPAGTISDGKVTAYDPFTSDYAITVSIPEPSTWAMMLLGFAGIGGLVYRRRRNGYAVA
ncbi:hypothetical protein V1277_004733 [Bradyrhizobium sp. AZCC 1588]|uniref:PEPxxWA-CTERM sorting domain-containing protein n=1 Tax=unclassified Bradyrhizobium TaxID=2631580 RepID=UPI002FF1CA85